MLGSGLIAMRTLLVILPALLFFAGGCGQQGSGATADCAAQIRVDDVVYTSYGFTRQPATEHGAAERAECDDVGSDPEGSVFPDDPATVSTWTFDGYSPDDVLGVKQGKRSFAVFIDTSVPEAERDRILADLE